ncbi:MAG: type I 3-dehydroquinate dehydratase [Ruminococcaceae bacterium]|nr:type I 3-dehydroquinate dehydratase [Oscillospiraceae bacterium]
MKKTFLHQEVPLITCMIQARTVARAKELIALGKDDCDAYGLQVCQMKPEERTDDALRSLFEEMGDKPVYVTNYRYGFNTGKSEETLAEELLHLATLGATLLDVTGDFYCPEPEQLTRSKEAVEKQKALIAALHERGAEVLMSSHVLRFLPPQEVLEMAQEQVSRGADVAKLVTAGNNDRESHENLYTTALLKEKLNADYLFLSIGDCCRRHRLLGAPNGCAMWLTVAEHDELSSKQQPLCREVRVLKELIYGK